VPLRHLDAPLVLGLLGEADGFAGGYGPFICLRRLAKQLHHGGRVAGEDLSRPGDVVEPEEDVGDDELALRHIGSVDRERDRPLELRDVVVPEVADDRHAEPLGLLEGDDPVTAADE